MKFERLGIIGCGLMGCSFALAVRKAGLVKSIAGYSKSPTTTESAVAAGILDESSPSALQVVSRADLILVAVPVGAMSKIFTDIASLISPDALIMDVGSTKLDVIAAARDGLDARIGNFVPTHPIAGNNLAGFRAAKEDMFEKTKVVLTPIDETKQVQLNNAVGIWEAIGAKVQMMTAEEHDEALGAVSHFPHLLAYAYMSHIIEQPQGARFLSLAGQGFRDFTRIASSEPNLWRDVFFANKQQMLEHIANYKHVLTQYEKMLQKDDAQGLLQILHEVSEVRSAWSQGDGASFISHHGTHAKELGSHEGGFWGRLFSKSKGDH